MVVVGSSIGTESKECGRDTDSCYNVTADVNSFSVLQKAGCNTLLCQFNENQCTQKHISGIPVTFCCCKDADFCNNNSTVEDDGSLIDKGATVLKGITEILG
ncbi:hypothetical protein Q1695_011574 [Nippostrongylus brasiliensis]|nr:hypothetical protein Q1695_011574 [Nippostrongylus brasiliensis]